MAQLKPISKESIPRALTRAERYRLLNEPFFAESICLDVLAIDPGDQRALTMYVLSLSDQLATGIEKISTRARTAIARMTSEYDRTYYTGLVWERRAVAILARGGFGNRAAGWHNIHEAMDFYEKADALQQDATNDDALLRYNTCVRLIEARQLTEPVPDRQDYPLE